MAQEVQGLAQVGCDRWVGGEGWEAGRTGLLSLSLLEFRAETKLETLLPKCKICVSKPKLNFKLCPKSSMFIFETVHYTVNFEFGVESFGSNFNYKIDEDDV